MKQCPKCQTSHEKSGRYCSRTCANSRTFSDESKEKKSVALRGRKLTYTKCEPTSSARKKYSIARRKYSSREERKEAIQQLWRIKYENTPFEELGCENRRRRILEEQNHCCNGCGISEWRGIKVTLEVDHKDGNRENDTRENLEGLCPNCHSITDTWRGRNKPIKNGVNSATDEEIIDSLKSSKNIRQALLNVGLAAKGDNYARAKNLLDTIN